MSENNAVAVKAVNPSLQKPTAAYMFLGYFLWPFSLIGLAIEKEDDFIRFHCAQAMAFFFLQLAIGILFGIAMLLTIIIIGFILIPFVIAVFIASYVFMIIALVKITKGERYMIPLLGGIADKNIKKWFAK